LYAQLIQAPNEIKNGMKEGLWNEMEFMINMDIDGGTQLIKDLHFIPEHILAEGQYLNGYRNGVWRNFFIERYHDSGNSKYRKGQLKDLLVYENSYLKGLYISYFRNGQVRLLGEYCTIEDHRMDTLQVPVGETDQVEDKIFESFYRSEMTGNWYEFDHSGELIQVKNLGRPAGCLQKLPNLPKINPNPATLIQLK
jgi:antitoxin component YwqK of YwqJK toxin-antitoxin module